MSRWWARICGRRVPSPNHPAVAAKRPEVTRRIEELPYRVDQLLVMGALDGVHDVGITLHFAHPRMAITALYQVATDPEWLGKLATAMEAQHAAADRGHL